MPDKVLSLAGGVFRSPGRQRDKDEEDATELGRAVQQVDDPRTGAVFLSLVNRLSVLEAAVRGARLGQLGAEERAEVLVIDNEEATARIAALENSVFRIRQLFDDHLAGEPDEMGQALSPDPQIGGRQLAIVQIYAKSWERLVRQFIASLV